MYLCIRSTLRAYGVPWNSQLPVHPLRKLILPSEESPSSASVIYLFLLEHSYKPLSITTVWAKDLNEDVHVLLSDQVWDMFKLSSKNPNHQMIHWKLLHRVYLTPMKCFYMNLSSSPKYNLCSQGSLGTFLHFFWECPSLSPFWTQLSKDLSFLLGTEICLTPHHFFMNDFWDFTLFIQQRCLLLADLTAAKKNASQLLESSSHNGQTNLDCVFVEHYLDGTLNFSYTWI